MYPCSILENGWAADIHDVDYETMEVQGGMLEVETPIMQSTGLKDKNGKEVYEGDIVKNIKFKDGSDYGEADLHVYYEKGAFGVGMAFLHDVKELEVIGNIHEEK